MAQQTCTVAAYVYISGSWTLLDDVAPINFHWGIGDNSPFSRLADTGQLDLILNNNTYTYTPGHASALAGWDTGLPVKIVVTYDGETFVCLRDRISDIEVRQHNKDVKAYVTVLDWMDYAARHKVINPTALSDIRADKMLQEVLKDMPILPQELDIDNGREVFETAFDAGNNKTKAYNEFAKIALSEIGYIYLKKNKASGERLKFEAANARHGWRPVDLVPVSSTNSNFGLHENGDTKLHENGDFWLLAQTEAVEFNSSVVESFEAPFGEHLINQVTVNVEPRIMDAAPVVLFTAGWEMVIASGQTKKIKGKYANPTGGAPIHGEDMIDPVITTDYTMFTATNGGGSNISTDLAVTASYGAEGFTHTVTNNNGARGYINFFQCRGTGIYKDYPTEYVAEDAASIDEFDYAAQSIHQAYQQDTESGTPFADAVVADFSQPKIVLNSISFTANKSAQRMMAALCTDVGHLRHIVISELELDGNYYIQGIAMSIAGGIIKVTWIVKEAPSLLLGMSPIAMDFDSTDAVNFGILDYLHNIRAKSVSMWVYQPDIVGGDRYAIFLGDAATGFSVLLNAGFIRFKCPSMGGGTWQTTAAEVAAGAWYHVCVTYDLSSNIYSNPIVYVNGSSKAITTIDPPAGNFQNEGANSIMFGNIKTATSDYNFTLAGKLFDPRIYNRILTSAEVTTLYNAGVPLTTLVTDGLVFQGFTVPTGNLTDYVNITLDSTYTVRDNVYNKFGKINGAPIGRAAP